jgi:uncharacterized surface protein with fasciclin (FAS1) repeats
MIKERLLLINYIPFRFQRIKYISVPFLLLLILFITLNSCEEKDNITAGFKDVIATSIQKYLSDNESQYSDFLAILKSGKMDITLKAYNPNGSNYTLFLPSNEAVEEFIQNSTQYNSLLELSNDSAFCRKISKYHIMNQGIQSSEFPIGTFPSRTLLNNYLTVNVEFTGDSAFYMINDNSRVIRPNIEMSNGIIHVIDQILIPATLTIGEIIDMSVEQSIFNEALKQTGFYDILSEANVENSLQAIYYTVLVEMDSVFHKSDIFSFDDLGQKISPGNTNYADPFNPLNVFIGYHIIEGAYFLDAFEGRATNYNTLAKIPIDINGTGLEIAINKGKEILETIISGEDTIIIDNISMFFDESNLLASNGVIHYIDYVMNPVPPSRVVKTFEFFEEALINEFKLIPGSYLIEDTASLNRIVWTGGELSYVKSADAAEKAWNKDYLVIDGDFELIYTIPAIVPGRYKLSMQAHSNSQFNASIIVYLDGVKLGGLIDLSAGGNPYTKFELGNVDFSNYSQHTIRIESLIPGRFIWDYIRFEPI